MELSALKEHIENKDPLTFMVGPTIAFECLDRAIADAYVRRIAEVYGMSLEPRDSVEDVARDASNVGFFQVQPRLFVVRDDPKADGSQSPCSGDDLLVLIMDAPAKASVAKSFGDALVRVDRISRKVMAEQVIPTLVEGLSAESADRLASLCGCDYGRCASEADKVARLGDESGKGAEWAFRYLSGTGQIGEEPMNDRFHFANSFVMGSRETFGACYGVDPMELISLLYAQCRSMYLAICAGDGPDACRSVGMSYAQFNAYRHKRHSVKTRDLISVMGVLQRAERGIKTGTMPKELAMKYVMAKAFGYAIR